MFYGKDEEERIFKIGDLASIGIKLFFSTAMMTFDKMLMF